MYPFGSLPDNLIAFCAVLRREYGFRIGTGEVHDAARTLALIDLTHEQAVRDGLRPVLSRTRDDAMVFDRAFTDFFFPGAAGPGRLKIATGRELAPQTGRRDERVPPGRAMRREVEREEGAEPIGAPLTPLATEEAEAAAPALIGRTSYSPLEAEAEGESPILPRVEPAWRDAARMLVRRLQLGRSRRWRPAARGRRFDLRRTLRSSLQTGGEAKMTRWLRRQSRTPRVVLLIDGSRSMGAYAQIALQLAVAMASVTMRLEVFTFSTALQRITGDVRRAAAGETRRLERLQYAWAGGTSIGHCLRDFVRGFGERMLGRDTVVMIVSDGLDVGETDTLQEAMRDLHRRSAGVVWLNPLLETPGYEPIATGMRVARPYVSTFTCVNEAAGLAHLSRVIRLRAGPPAIA